MLIMAWVTFGFANPTFYVSWHSVQAAISQFEICDWNMAGD